MLSKRMTAKSLELKPASQARKRMVNDSRDCHPAGCDRPPDRPPAAPALPPRSAAALLRPFPEYDAPELSDDLCLLSEAGWCSAMFYVSPTVDSDRSEALFYHTGKESLPPPSRCHAPLQKPTKSPFPCTAPHPLNTYFLSKLSNFTSHQVQSQINIPRKSHSSGVLQHTGSDTCGWSSSSFLPWSWIEGAGPTGGACQSETGTSGRESAPGGSQSRGRTRLMDSRASQWNQQPRTPRTLRRKCERWRMTDRRKSVWHANNAGAPRANEINE